MYHVRQVGPPAHEKKAPLMLPLPACRMASACKSALAKEDGDEAFVSDCLAEKTFWEENIMCLDNVDAPELPPCFTGAQSLPTCPLNSGAEVPSCARHC